MQIMLADLSLVTARSLFAIIARKTKATVIIIIKGNYLETLSSYYHCYFLAIT